MRDTHFISKDSHAKHPDAVGDKIAYLIKEGKPQKQAVAIALSMKRAGRLGPHGEYRRVKKK